MKDPKHEWASNKQGCAIQALRNLAVWTYRQIAKVQNLSLGAVYNICQSSTIPKKLKGRMFSLNTPTGRQLAATATMKTAYCQMLLVEVPGAYSIEVSERTIRKAFQKEGYFPIVAQRKPFLHELKKKATLSICNCRLGLNSRGLAPCHLD
ncbi:hypothetical protein B9Z19DRAFT_1064107 [Tuber borchii]|uniref:Transposase Tc1-like domain-containing protein n=1 Tax=Tuber borchii TaxID=42251 RepID=A0A2T6ZVV6_TUBBO|nr:hypothetical protein B9Z19DRAFT_1064107 [Tuber borchii]